MSSLLRVLPAAHLNPIPCAHCPFVATARTVGRSLKYWASHVLAVHLVIVRQQATPETRAVFAEEDLHG